MRGAISSPAVQGVPVERDGAIMAATIDGPVSRPARRQHRRFPAPVVVGVALVLAVTGALIFIPVARSGTRPGRPPDGNAARRATSRAWTVRKLTTSDRSRAQAKGPSDGESGHVV